MQVRDFLKRVRWILWRKAIYWNIFSPTRSGEKYEHLELLRSSINFSIWVHHFFHQQKMYWLSFFKWGIFYSAHERYSLNATQTDPHCLSSHCNLNATYSTFVFLGCMKNAVVFSNVLWLSTLTRDLSCILLSLFERFWNIMDLQPWHVLLCDSFVIVYSFFIQECLGKPKTLYICLWKLSYLLLK